MDFCSSSSGAAISLMFLMLLINQSGQASAASSTHPANDTDFFALLDIKNQISDDPFGILKSWNTTNHHCQWLGVTCRLDQSVIGLNLFGQNLLGSISSQIGNLSFLESIDLRNNRFHGYIPQEVGLLFRLQRLYISNNSLDGEIPVNLTNCFELKTFDAVRNKLVGIIPPEIGSLVKLEGLYVGRNNLSGEIPRSIGNLTALRQLYISLNNLKGHLPEELGRLTRLYSIGFDGNFLAGTIPSSLFNISTLAGISASDNLLEGTIPANVGLTFPVIQEFFVGANHLEGTIPVSFTNATLLEKLDLGSNRFKGQVPTNFGHLTNLQWFSVQNNLLGSNSSGDLDFISSLSNCSKLNSLIVSWNNFGGTLPDSIGNLSVNIVQIDLGLNQISGEIPEGLGNLANLYLLGMDHNLFSGYIPSFLHKFQNLQKLFLNNNKLSGQIPSVLFNMTSLYGLYLSDNELEGNLPQIEADSESLHELVLSGNNLNGSIPAEIFSFFSALTFLNLSNNFFSCSLPTEIEMLKNVYKLDISRNALSGEIPQTISECSDLEYIYMQENHFQGGIPPSLSSLKAIQVLDLAENNLTGEIPEDLYKLPFVQFMNLSFNDLEGRVPTAGFFSNASAISLLGNSKLCGGIPELKLQLCPEEKPKRKKSLAPGFIALIILLTLISVAAILFCIVYYGRRTRRRESFTATEPFSGISYHELHQATRGFSSDNLVGSGSFGSVYKGTLQLQGESLVAVKVLDLQKDGASKSFLAECLALRNIRHRNLVKILSCCSSNDYQGKEFKALVYKYMPNGNLDMWLHQKADDNHNVSSAIRPLNLLQRLNIAMDVAYALDYLHNQCETTVVHCDLKPSNVLLDENLVAHVGDFGLAKLLHHDAGKHSQRETSSTGLKGTIGYAAPEYGMGGQVSTQGDVYSYGILLLEMITGQRPTNELFKDGLNLHEYVKGAIFKVSKIVDPHILVLGKEEDENYQGKVSDMEKTEDKKGLEKVTTKCLTALLEIGLSCTSQLPKERMDMMDVVKELNMIKNAFFNGG
ncbi:OLC1v1008532C1 [Oldenlandia corymbosa var. corymbosa]|uniref:non-specific serine/threonine protein kinase n=1 Tax=Oldenlandia corymbosa var. corymbosa TaxID=529605 RepID=A0AAV1DLS0_OLDCO|nr:OLC1v1008532C1 [Oldenlandia corymbosa var. corymbosa]